MYVYSKLHSSCTMLKIQNDSPTQEILKIEKKIGMGSGKHCSNFENDFELTGFMGEGGSAYILGGTVNVNLPMYNLQKGEQIAIKLCKPFLTIEGCNALIDEVNNLTSLTELRTQQRCYNYPIFYMYRKCCLFVSGHKRDAILKIWETNTLYNAYFLHANTSPLSKIPQRLANFITKNIDPETFNKIRPHLKLNNFKVLTKMLQNGVKYESDSIVNFIDDESDMECANFIVLNKIHGSNLDQIKKITPTFKFDSGLTFDLVYGYIAAAKYANITLLDNHDDNIMITELDVPRAYKIGKTYMKFPPGLTLTYIDAQTVKEYTPSELSTFNIRVLYPYIPNSGFKKQLYSTSHNIDNIASLLVKYFNNFSITENEYNKYLVQYPQMKLAVFDL